MKELGIGSYKTKAYVALLSIRKGSVQEIAKNSTVPSCKLYEVLKWLHENGYTTMISQKPLVYRANNPKVILRDEISRRRKDLDRAEEKLSSLKLDLPVSEKNIVQITTTRDAYFRKVKESVENARKSIHYIAKHWRLDAELVKALGKKAKEGVEIKALGPVTKETMQKVRWLKKAGVMARNIEPSATRFSVYDGELVIISLRREDEKKKDNYSAVWINSEVLAQILEKYFKKLWDAAD